MSRLHSSRPLVVLLGLFFALSSLLSQGSSATAQPLRAFSSLGLGQPLTRVEIPSRRTATSRTYQEGNHYVAQVYAAPVNFRDAQGAWQPIDDTLVPSNTAGYAHENHANRYTVRFPKDIATQPIRLESGTNWVSFRPIGLTGTGTASGETETYSGNGYTIAYLAAPNEVKETITLQSAAAPATYTYDLHLSPGLTARSTAAGRTEIVDQSGVVQFAFDRPWMTDASGPGSMSLAVSTALATTGNRTTLTLSIDPTWLTAPGRQFPVTVDPTLQLLSSGNQPADRSCSLYAGDPTTSYCSGSDLFTGLNSTSAVWRSLLHFDLSGVPSGTTVFSSALHVYLSYSGYAPTASTVNVDSVNQFGWTTAATWNTYDGTRPWITPGGDFQSSPAGSLTFPGTAPLGWHQWNLTPSVVESWIYGPATNGGLEMVSSNESLQDLLIFDSVNAGSQYIPYLTVTYSLNTGIHSWDTIDSYGLSDQLSAGVNVANGNLIVQQSNFAMPGRGLPVSVDSYYNSFSRTLGNPEMANGWDTTVGQDVGLQILGNSISYQGPSSTVDWFTKNGSVYTSPPGMDATLVQNGDGTYTLTDHASQEKLNFNSGGELLSDVDRSGNTLSFAYDSPGYGNTASITDTQGRTTSFTYSSGNVGSLTQIQDPAGRQYGYGYTNNEITSYTDPTNQTAQFAYGTGTDGNPLNAIIQITDPKGNVTRFTYTTDGYGIAHVASVTQVIPAGQPNPPCPSLSCTTTYSYSPGQTVVTDPNGHQTTYLFDTSGRVDSMTDAWNHTTQTSWSSDNHIQTVKSPRGYTTTYLYDSKNNPLSTQIPTGPKWSCAYANLTWIYQPSSCTDEQGHITTYGYDAAGRLNSVKNALGYTSTVLYNTDGSVATSTDAKSHTTTYSYYPNGTDIGLLSQVTYPPATNGLGSQSVTYDSANRPYQETDGKGQVTTYTYDNLDRPMLIEFQNYGGGSAGSQSYSYDLDGNISTMTDATGTTSYAYNALNEQTSQLLPTGSSFDCPGTVTLASTCYTYDSASNLMSKQDGGGTVSYLYNPDNTLSSVTDPLSNVTTFGYDADSNQTAINYPGGTTETTGYDTADAVTSVVGAHSGTTITAATYSHTNPATLKYTSLWYSVTDAGNNSTKYTYDAVNELKTGIQKNGVGTQIASYSYSYDQVGNMSLINGSGAVYNADDELTGIAGRTYSYDANGNQMSSTSGNSFAYNAQDQTTSITPHLGLAITMTYTGGGQSSRTVDGTWTYAYDRNGIGSTGSGSTATYFTTTPDGQVLSERIPGGTTGCTLPSGQWCAYYYLHDGIGSVTAIVNNVGQTQDSYAYDPYGNTTSTTGSTPNPFCYIGAIWDSQTKMYAMGERYYDPATGRFAQEDPLGGEFSYASDNPVNRLDPSGLADDAGGGEDLPLGGGGGGGGVSGGGGEEAPSAANNAQEAQAQERGEGKKNPGERFRGGPKSARDADLNKYPNEFRKWLEGAKARGVRHLTTEELEQYYEEWQQLWRNKGGGRGR